MNPIEVALAAVRLKMTEMAPAHEGLRDYMGMNAFSDAAKAVIQTQLVKYDAMLAALKAVEAALMALLELPVLGPISVPDAELDDIQNQLDTITAARAQFAPLAVGGEITFGPEHN